MSGARRHLHRSLTPGLLMRPPRPDETEEIVDFVFRVFSGAIGEPDETAAIWARDLLRGDHPTSSPIDGTVVVDTVRHRIASCCFLIRQTWSYAGIPISVGRPELIGTDPEYRGHGLVRAQLAEAHSHGEVQGELVQAITGIPWFYRQFGYEPAIITNAVHTGDPASIPALPDRVAEAFPIRPATEVDLPLIERLYRRAAERALVSTIRDEAIWRYELSGRTPRSDYLHHLRIIETAAGSPAGFFAYHADLRGGTLSCTVCELEDEVAWDAVAPAVLRALRAAGEALSSELGLPFDRIAFDWTPGHPFPVAAGLHPDPADAFAWYIRVPDLPAFVRHIAPVLETRLARSEFAGLTRELGITFYRDGLRLAFADGRLSAVDRVPGISHRVADAAFPGLTFLQLLFGSRRFQELAFAFPNEVRVRDDATRALLTTLFPCLPSAIWPIA
jgi:GNAT superfamily N-acetyltransferase